MRVLLNGEGTPIPIQALPDELAISDLPPLTFVLDGTEDFPAGDYASLGYTNFEAICIGAAGGRGGDAYQSAQFDYSWETGVHIPDSLWSAYLDWTRAIYEAAIDESTDQIKVSKIDHRVTAPLSDPFYTPVNSEFIPFLTWINEMNPTHVSPTITRYFSPYLISAKIWGGGGGGGGLHIAGGLLSELPASVPVVVGKVGANGAGGHMQSANPHIFLPFDIEFFNDTPFDEWLRRYDEPRTSFSPPQPGVDGGHSAFGDVCQASGGKGGGAAIVWPGGVLTQDGHGGDGGAGDRIVAGGGAAGATTTLDGAEGTWDGVIGKGGGGGRGGSRATGAIPERSAGQGGRGSYSFADTSMYGDRQIKAQYQTPSYQIAQTHPTSTLTENRVASVTFANSGWLVIPGGGGGAKLKPPLTGKYGSKATSYSPDGAVLLRISKVE